MIDAMAGHVYMESGDVRPAIARFEAALARYPNKMQLVYDYPEALSWPAATPKPRRSAKNSSSVSRRRPPALDRRARFRLGQRQLQHRHQGEYYAWQGI